MTAATSSSSGSGAFRAAKGSRPALDRLVDLLSAPRTERVRAFLKRYNDRYRI